MDEDDVLNAMKMLPSAAINRIKEYESQRDDPRQRIVGYNVGFGESAVDRQEGRVSSDLQDTDESKAAARLNTREVPDEGLVVPGEGITGTGDPQVSYGSREGDDDAPSPTAIKGTGRTARRGRRDRQPKPQRDRLRHRWKRRTSNNGDNSRARSWRLLIHQLRLRHGMNFPRRGMRCWRLQRSVNRLSNVV